MELIVTSQLITRDDLLIACTTSYTFLECVEFSSDRSEYLQRAVFSFDMVAVV